MLDYLRWSKNNLVVEGCRQHFYRKIVTIGEIIGHLCLYHCVSHSVGIYHSHIYVREGNNADGEKNQLASGEYYFLVNFQP